MSRQNTYEPYRPGKIQDIRLAPGYIPAYNRGNQSGRHRSLIPGRKRQFNRVYHDSPPNQLRSGSSGNTGRTITDENRPRKCLFQFIHFSKSILARVNQIKEENSPRVKLEFPTTIHPPVPAGYKGKNFIIEP